MGYYVTGEGHFRIANNDKEAALQALKDLNYQNDLKNGGSYPSNVSPLKTGPREDRWFSWMPWDYNETVNSISEVLELLGFEVYATNKGGYTRYGLRYDNKTGQEELFLITIAQYVVDGQVEWRGEDGYLWRNVFSDGVLKSQQAVVTWE